MRLSALLSSLTLVALLFAGCSGDADGDGGDGTSSSSSSSRASSSTGASSSSSSSSTGSASSTSSGAPAENRPPTGSLSVTVEGSNATFGLTGTDPDGDILVWDLSFGDGSSTNGTTLPANATHAYAAGGNFTANFTVTDGTDPTSYDVLVAIVGSGAGATSFVFIGDVEQDCATQCELGTPVGSPPVPLPGAAGCVSFNTDMPGLDCIWTELTPDLVGKAFTLVSTSEDPDVEFFDACDPVMGSSLATFYNAGPEAGTVPDGAGCAVLWEFNPAPSTITLTIG